MVPQVPQLDGLIHAEAEHMVELLIQSQGGDTAGVTPQLTNTATCGSLEQCSPTDIPNTLTYTTRPRSIMRYQGKRNHILVDHAEILGEDYVRSEGWGWFCMLAWRVLRLALPWLHFMSLYIAVWLHDRCREGAAATGLKRC
jgi:hypothetical protein